MPARSSDPCRRRLVALVALCAILVVSCSAPAPPAPGVTVTGLSTAKSSYEPGDAVTFGATISVTGQSLRYARLVLAVRDDTGHNFDFQVRRESLLVGQSPQTISESRVFGAGTFTYWVAGFDGLTWTELTPHGTLVVGSGTSATATATAPVTPAPAPTPASAPPPSATVRPAPPLAVGSTPVTARAALVGLSIPSRQLLYESQAALDDDLDRTVASGATWIRVDVPMTEIEVAKGTTDWSNFDRLVDGAGVRNLKILGILTTLPVWSRPAGTAWNYGPTTDGERQAFADLASRAATRYHDRVDAWEVWNEPNLDQFWAPTPSAGDYAKLLQVVTPLLRAADPAATILSGGTGWAGPAPDIATDAWYDQLYTLGAPALVDALSTHPYPDFSDVAGGEMGQSLRLRKIMDAHGDLGRQLWGTETGAPTGGQTSISEPAQATLLTQTYTLWSSIPNHGPLFYYTLTDFSNDPGDRESTFGLFRTNSTAKPSELALRNWIRFH